MSEAAVAVIVTVIATAGSTPREVGARMSVLLEHCEGTIGGGALEWAAIGHARDLLARGVSADLPHRETVEYPLGPNLQQCCGGWVELLFEADTCHAQAATDPDAVVVRPLVSGPAAVTVRSRSEARRLPVSVAGQVLRLLSGTEPRWPCLAISGAERWFIEPAVAPRTALFIYGAGHVGREIALAVERLPFDVTWIDFAADRFPTETCRNVICMVTERPAEVAAVAPPGSFHVIATHSHAVDEAIVAAALGNGQLGYVGVIGSATKRARFLQRLERSGLSMAALSKLVCPIGGQRRGSKSPPMIAVAVAAELAGLHEQALAASASHNRSSS